MTKKQQQEIAFLTGVFCNTKPTQKEVVEYISKTVHGGLGETAKMGAKNKLLNAKAMLDMNMKMWIEDVTRGFFTPYEIVSDWEEYEYSKTIMKALIKQVLENPQPDFYENREIFSNRLLREKLV